MACGPKPIALSLTDGEQARLPRPNRWRRTGQDVAMHARIPLLCADPDVTSTAIAARLGPGRRSVVTWWQRLPAQLGKGLSDVMRGGALRRVGDIAIERLVAPTLEAQAEGAVHWSMRWMAKRAGPSPAMILRIWRAFGWQPRRTESFNLPREPGTVDRVRSVIRFYLAPPDGALVSCVDKEPQGQAAGGTRPVLPMRPGRLGRRSHDDQRHDTTDRFAALDVKAGTVTGACTGRHRAVEFRALSRSPCLRCASSASVCSMPCRS